MSTTHRTAFAAKAAGLADIFKWVLGKDVLAGHYKVELTAPEGPSTGGGKQAVQHINLVAEGAAVIVAGSIDGKAQVAELRSYARLSEIHAGRFHGERLPVGQAEYDALIDKIAKLLVQQQIQVKLEPAAGRVDSAADAERTSPVVIVVAVLGVLGLGAGVAFYFLR
jgi:hypothetical protein